jgi:hypothetical protein
VTNDEAEHSAGEEELLLELSGGKKGGSRPAFRHYSSSRYLWGPKDTYGDLLHYCTSAPESLASLGSLITGESSEKS